MNIYAYEEAFGAADKTSRSMRQAIDKWYALYFGKAGIQDTNPCQRIPYTVVNHLVKAVFGEYAVRAEGELEKQVVMALNSKSREAMQQALVGGECYLKPWFDKGNLCFGVIPRRNALIFGRNADGEPTDMGTVERSTHGRYYYTLMERRYIDESGCTVIENKLFRSLNSDSIGQQVPLRELDDYKDLPDIYRYGEGFGSVGLVRLRNPVLNCVDGSNEGVSVYAAAVGLIAAAVISMVWEVLFPAEFSWNVFAGAQIYVSLVIAGLGLFLLLKLKKHPILIICISAVLGIAAGYIFGL